MGQKASAAVRRGGAVRVDTLKSLNRIGRGCDTLRLSVQAVSSRERCGSRVDTEPIRTAAEAEGFTGDEALRQASQGDGVRVTDDGLILCGCSRLSPIT